MPLPTAVLTYGATSLFLGETPRITLRSDGFDEGQFEFHLGDESSLRPGNVVPGYAGMYISEDSITDHSGDLEHSVRAVGLRTGTQRLLKSMINSVEDGFDTGTETWLAVPFASFTYGRQHSDSSQMYCVGIQEASTSIPQYRQFELQFKGIGKGGRPDRYKFGTLTREMTIENAVINGAGGDANPHTWNIAIGSATMDRSYLSTAAPDYSLVGKQIATPAGFPNTAPIPWTVPTEVVKWQWPNGVMLASINAERILDRNVWFVTETYVQRDRLIV